MILMSNDKTFTTRLPAKQYDRLLEVVTETESEVSRSGLIRLALELFFAQLSVCPAIYKNKPGGSQNH